MKDLNESPELNLLLQKVFRYCGVLLLVCCLLIGFLNLGQEYWGVIIGLGVGMYNLFSLAKRLKNIPAFDQDSARKGLKLNFGLRFVSIVAILFLLVVYFPQVNLLGFIIGLAATYLICATAGLIEAVRQIKLSKVQKN